MSPLPTTTEVGSAEVSAFSQASCRSAFYRALDDLQPFGGLYVNQSRLMALVTWRGRRNPRRRPLPSPGPSWPPDFPVISQRTRNDLIRHRRSGDLPFNTRGIVIDLLADSSSSRTLNVFPDTARSRPVNLLRRCNKMRLPGSEKMPLSTYRRRRNIPVSAARLSRGNDDSRCRRLDVVASMSPREQSREKDDFRAVRNEGDGIAASEDGKYWMYK